MGFLLLYLVIGTIMAELGLIIDAREREPDAATAGAYLVNVLGWGFIVAYMFARWLTKLE